MKTEYNKTKSRYTKEFKDSIVKLAAKSKEPLSGCVTSAANDYLYYSLLNLNLNPLKTIPISLF